MIPIKSIELATSIKFESLLAKIQKQMDDYYYIGYENVHSSLDDCQNIETVRIKGAILQSILSDSRGF